MFTVFGYVSPGEGAAYRVAVTTDGDAGAVVTGHAGIADLVAAHVGEKIGAGPMCPFYTVDPNDPASILAALYGLTDVRKVEGDVPDVFGPRRPGTVN